MSSPPQNIIGRETERQQLTEWLAAANDSQPTVVLIEGEPGVGKTTLVAWLAAEAQRQRGLVLHGSCVGLSSGSAIPFHALVEGLRGFARHSPTEYEHLLQEQPWRTLDALIADSVRPATAALDPQPRVFGAVLVLPDHIGRRRPFLLLILENLHWADPSTLDLLGYVARSATEEKLLLVCTHRPVPPRHPLRVLLAEPDFRRRIQRLSLAPFNREETDELVTASAAGRTLSDDRRRRYFELSAGNAYYVEELVAADDVSRPAVAVPESLREALMARLNRLQPGAAGVVRIAAVAGTRIEDDLLSAVCELDGDRLDEAVSECVDERILIQDGAGGYVFQHALLLDTAYGMMRPGTRKAIHARIATAMAARPDQAKRLEPELANHWFEAGRQPEALAAGVRAAETAIRMGAFPEAARQYDRVVALWDDVPDAAVRAGAPLASVLGRAADAFRWANQVWRALELVRRALSAVDPANEPGRAGELRERLGSYLWEAARRDDAFAAYTEAEQLLTGLPPSAVASRVQSALANALMGRGKYAEGRRRAQEAAELARSVGARTEEGRALTSLGLALAFDGDIAGGEKALRVAVAIATEVDHLEDLFRAYGSLGVCLEQGGRLNDAVTAMMEGLERAEERGLLHTRQSDLLAGNAAAALLLLGRYEEGAALLDPVLSRRPVAESMYARLTRAEIHVAQGEYPAAATLLDEVRQEPIVDPRFIGPLYGCIADSLAWQGRLDEAEEVIADGMLAIAEVSSPRVVVQLAAIGLRVAADQENPRWAGELVARVLQVTAGPDGDEIALLIHQCHVEHARANAADSPGQWSDLADGWARLPQPFRAAYAHLARARAALRSDDRSTAGAAVRQAYEIGDRFGAQSVRVAARKLAVSAKLSLYKPRPYDLTEAETAVLRELATGASNAEIARRLGITKNTVSVHLVRINHKMGVHTRGEAVAKARADHTLDA